MCGICLVIPTAIIHMFIRAERESDWLLHLNCVQQMLPYFFAAGHSNYAQYGTWYLLEMQGAFSEAAHHIFMNRIRKLRVPSATKVV